MEDPDVTGAAQDVLVAGVIEAARNSAALAEEAEILFREGRWARALALAVAAIEEDGKGSFLGRMASGIDDPSGGAQHSRAHATKHHRTKQVEALRSIDLLYGPLALDRIAGGPSQAGVVREDMQVLRERALYVDVSSGGVTTPLDAVTQEQAASFLAVAKNLQLGRVWLHRSDPAVIREYFTLYGDIYRRHESEIVGDQPLQTVEAAVAAMRAELNERFEWDVDPPGTVVELRARSQAGPTTTAG